MEKDWHYLVNQLLNVTKESNVLGIGISNSHDGRLYGNIADPFIATLYANYHPIHLKYVKAFAFYKSKLMNQFSKTNVFKLLLVKLSFEKINAWDASI